MSLPIEIARQRNAGPCRMACNRSALSVAVALEAVQSRMQGPGGYYNLGNVLGLSVALALQLRATSPGDGELVDAAYDFFLGSPAAVSLTFATIVFLAGGEIYRAAWTKEPPQAQQLNRAADLVSAIGAVLLSLSLLLMGHTFLAIVSGLLIAGGKLGSAVTGDDPNELPLWPLHWPDPLRGAVLLGRVPGLAAASIDLLARAPHTGISSELLHPATLIVCFLLWIKADLMLVRHARTHSTA